MSENNPSDYEQQLKESRQVWNAEAATFDDQPDHGLRDPLILAAWTALLRKLLPPDKATVLDIGCGTGSLSLVLAGLGYDVTGIDFSPEMIALAKAKAAAANRSIQFHIMDAAFPQFPPQQFDGIVCRHVLWALPDIDQVLQRWVGLLKPGGRLLLIEGFWFTGAGLHAEDLTDAFPESVTNVSIQNLSVQPDLWGGAVSDERYAVTAEVQANH